MRPAQVGEMTMKVHVYTQKMQPSTNFTDNFGEVPIQLGYAPGALVYCQNCRRRRRAVNCAIQIYYDCSNIFCADGKGCKDPREIERKARRIRNNRSRGQKRRWNKPNAEVCGPAQEARRGK